MSIAIQEDDAGTKKDTLEALKKLKKDIADGDKIQKELARIWKKILRDAINMCPKDTGALARTIRITKVPTGSIMGGWSRIKEITLFDRSIIAGDVTQTNPKTKTPVDYATWVHDGHVRRDGLFHAGVPFLTHAIAMNEQELEKAIDRALKKIAQKYNKG